MQQTPLARVIPTFVPRSYADEILSKSSILRALCGPRGSVDDDAGINQDQGDFQTVVEGIFKGLRVSNTLAVSEAAQTPFRCAQAALIEGSGSLIGFIRTFKDKYLPACSPQLLRFGAHLVLYMKGCVKTLQWEEMQAPEEAEDDILEAYTVHLISQRQVRPAVGSSKTLVQFICVVCYMVLMLKLGIPWPWLRVAK